ncbi:MAG: GreA/GreB family elongation factor [Candidatus Dojkabacteria bacterium]
MAGIDRRKRILTKIDELKKQITELGTEIERERSESSEEDSAIRQELLDKREILDQQIIELKDSLALANNPDLENTDVGKLFVIEINGSKREVAIVLPDEADPSNGRISIQSPLALALAGRKKGETVSVETPIGPQNYRITGIT